MANSPSKGPRQANKGMKPARKEKQRKLLATFRQENLPVEVYKHFLRGSAFRAIRKARQP